MYAGRLVEEAPTAGIFADPKHPYTAHLVASLPELDGDRRRGIEGPGPGADLTRDHLSDTLPRVGGNVN